MDNTKDVNFMDIDEMEVPRAFHQHGMIVSDGSASMAELSASGNQTKAQAANGATRDVLARFKVSGNKRNFSMSVVTFDHLAKVHTDITAVSDIDDLASYDPMVGHGGGTDLANALEEAEKLIQRHIDEGNKPENHGIPHSVVVVVLSDGMSSGDPVAVANQMKSKFGEQLTICSAMFATKGQSSPQAIQILKDITTQPDKHYITVYDAESIRKFFIASMESRGNNIGMGA